MVHQVKYQYFWNYGKAKTLLFPNLTPERVLESWLLLQALRCISDLVVGHPGNQDPLGNKVIRKEPDIQPALNCVLRAFLQASNLSDCIATEYVVKCFCEVLLLITTTFLAVSFTFQLICLLSLQWTYIKWFVEHLVICFMGSVVMFNYSHLSF